MRPFVPLVSLTIIMAMGLACGPSRKHDDSDGGHPGDFSIGAPPPDQPANSVVGSFRGYAATNRTINERLFSRSDALALDDYIEDIDENDPFAVFPRLADLLGVFDGDGLHTGIKNAEPNSVNMLLWYLAIDGLASDLANTCGAPAEKPAFAASDLKQDVHQALQAVCTWPDATARDENNLRRLWRLAMHADAPEAEYLSWRDYVLGPTFDAVAVDAVHQMIMTMIYNPNFLLSK